MKVITQISLVAIASLGFVACSSEGSETSTSSGTSSYTLSGTVPGTLIEAFCMDGSYYKTNSTDNGTNNHPFELELPFNIDCRLVMTTNESDSDVRNHIVTPITISNGSTASSYFRLDGDSDLGYIGLPTTGTGLQPILEIATLEDKLKVVSHSNDPMDDDKDGIPNMYEDDDEDGKYNKDDEDDDGDGIEDKDDKDDRYDEDDDGIEDAYDKDDDGDGIEDSKDDDYEGNSVSPTVELPTSFNANGGRLLSSQCFQCHGTNGYSVNRWDSIAGEDDLLDEIHDDDPIMNAQAKGYTNNEINLIGNWLKTLPNNDD